MHDWIGSDKHVGIPGCTKHVRKNTSMETATAKGERTTVYTSAHRSSELYERYDAESMSWHPLRFPANSVEDIKMLTEIYDDTSVELDTESLAKGRQKADEIGQDAVTANGIGESPLM